MNKEEKTKHLKHQLPRKGAKRTSKDAKTSSLVLPASIYKNDLIKYLHIFFLMQHNACIQQENYELNHRTAALPSEPSLEHHNGLSQVDWIQ
jgi:hypothetical protein